MATIHEFDESYLFKLIDEKLTSADLKTLIEEKTQIKKEENIFFFCIFLNSFISLQIKAFML